MMRISKIIIAFVCFAVIGCAETQTQTEKLVQTDVKEGEKYLSLVKKLNANLPETFTTGISVKARINKKSFSSSGQIIYATNPVAVKVRLNDVIFGTPVIEMLLADDVLKIYQPYNKTMHVRPWTENGNFKTLDFDPTTISLVMLERVPVISNGTVTKSYQSETSSTYVVVLESQEYSESIFFEGEYPVKVVIISKVTNATYEADYSSPFTVEGYTFFGKVSAVSSASGNSFAIEYKNTKVNQPVDRLKSFKLNVPADTKIIE